jgi:hypothetical protein
MAGLLDWFGTQQPGALGGLLGGQFSADAGTDADVRKALLAAGFGMLQSRGARGIGQGGLQGLQTFGLAQEGRRRNEFQDFTIGEAKRKAEAEAKSKAALDQLRMSLPSPQMLGSQQALAGGGGPTVQNAAKIPAADPFLDMLYQTMQAGGVSPTDYIAATKPQAKAPIKLSEGDQLLDPLTRELLAANPKPQADKTPEALRAIEAVYGKDSPEYTRLAREYINKVSTHQPPVQVSFGPPVAGVDANGDPVYFQPGKGGGPPAIVPGVKPPPPKMGEKQVNQIAGIDALGSAVDEYVSAMSGWKKSDALNPNKRAAIGTAYNNMMLQAKEAYNLGVLNGPDYSILQSVVKDPTSWSAAITSNEALIQQANELKRIMGGVRDAVTNAKKPKPPAAAASAAAGKTVNLNRLTPAQKAEYEALQKELGVK